MGKNVSLFTFITQFILKLLRYNKRRCTKFVLILIIKERRLIDILIPGEIYLHKDEDGLYSDKYSCMKHHDCCVTQETPVQIDLTQEETPDRTARRLTQSAILILFRVQRLGSWSRSPGSGGGRRS